MFSISQLSIQNVKPWSYWAGSSGKRSSPLQSFYWIITAWTLLLWTWCFTSKCIDFQCRRARARAPCLTDREHVIFKSIPLTNQSKNMCVVQSVFPSSSKAWCACLLLLVLPCRRSKLVVCVIFPIDRKLTLHLWVTSCHSYNAHLSAGGDSLCGFMWRSSLFPLCSCADAVLQAINLFFCFIQTCLLRLLRLLCLSLLCCFMWIDLQESSIT